MLRSRVQVATDPPRGFTVSPSYAALMVLGGVTVGAISQGAMFTRGRLLMAGCLAAAGLLFVAGRRQEWGGLWSPIPLASLALGSWALARGAASGDMTTGFGTVALLAGFSLVCVVMSAEQPGGRDSVLSALLLVGVGLALSGWVGVALHWEPLALAPAGVWRAATFITYSNGSAAVLVALALVAIGLYAKRPSMTTATTAMVLLLGAITTLSRAGALAGVAGLVLLGILIGGRPLLAALVAPAAGASIAFMGLLPGLAASSEARPLVAVAALVVGIETTAAIHVWTVRNAIRAAVLAAVAAGMLVGALLAAGSELTAGLSARLVPADRLARSEAALELLGDEPIVGIGPGALWLTWEGPGGRTVGAWFVHDEYLQLLVQLGAVGGVLLLAFLAAVAVAVRSGRPQDGSVEVWAGVAAGLVALAVHSAFDFLWHIPAIPILAALLVGLASASNSHCAVDRKEQDG